MSGHNDPKLLYAINGVQAFHIANGKEEILTSSGPQTLSLLMVPTSSPFAEVTGSAGTNTPPEDFYLHLHLPPELDLPLPATTQIYHQPPTSYLIPRWDLGPDSGAFTRIEFPAAGSRAGVQEDVDTFETILAQCTAFLERAPPPKGASSKAQEAGFATSRSAEVRRESKMSGGISEPLPAYNPADYTTGEAYATGSHSKSAGRIVLVDEEDGSVIGELTDGYQVNDLKVLPGSKDPVEISLPTDANGAVIVQPASREYVEKMMHPSYKKSSLVSGATRASRLIVTSSDMITKGLQGGADTFQQKTKPNATPVSFSATTHSHIRRINTFSTKAAGLSATTVTHISKYAQNFGASLARKDGGGKGYDANGNVIESYKPGLLNRSFMAFSTVADGVEQGAKNLLGGTTSSVTKIVEHRWGSEAGEASRNIGGGFKNVGLVYIDVTGVSRRAILKSVAKGMVVGKVADGSQVIVGGGDGGSISQAQLIEGKNDRSDAASVVTDYEGNGKKPSKGRFF